MEPTEIMILGRGGQGNVTTAKILAYAVVTEGKNAMVIPKYGAERRGAPVQASVRIAEGDLRMHAQVVTPNHIISMDETLIRKILPPKPIKEHGTITVNTDKLEDTFEEYKPSKIGVINAIQIANEIGLTRSGVSLISIPVLAAFARVTGIVKLESINEAVKHYISSSEWVEKNIQAAKLAYERTVIPIESK